MLFTVFFVCFGVGVGFVVISFLIGEFGGEFDTGTGVPWLRPSIGASFLVIFGGVGILIEPHLFGALAIGIAFFAGFFVSLAFHRFVIIPLKNMENTSSVDRQMLIGQEAVTVERIPQGQYGKITLTVNGNKLSGPAKSEDGSEIPRHQAVEIIYIERNTYYVRKK